MSGLDTQASQVDDGRVAAAADVGFVPADPDDASLAHLLGRLAVVEARTAAAVSARQRSDGAPPTRYRGIVLTGDDVEAVLRRPPSLSPVVDPAAQLLDAVEAEADVAGAAGERLLLRDLASAFGLTVLDIELLLVALAPDLDARFEPLFAYLHDDVTRRRASTGLAMELAGATPVDASARRRLSRGAPLIDAGLVEVEGTDRPFLSRGLRVPDPVVAHLLGDPQPEPLLASIAIEPTPCLGGDPEALSRALRAGSRTILLRERYGASGWALGAAAMQELGLDPIVVDLQKLDPAARGESLPQIVRAAKLAARPLVAGPIDGFTGIELRAFVDTDWPVILTGRCAWDPAAGRAPLEVTVPVATSADRTALWRALVDGDGLDVGAVAAPYTFSPERIPEAVALAEIHAAYEGTKLEERHLRAGARAQGSSTLERLARRIRPSVGWDDLVVPKQLRSQLERFTGRARHRSQVLDEWGLRPGSRGQGVVALFAGPSGTGKTLSAEVIAGELGLDLFAVDLATVVDKYIGETEKNLERVFDEAEGSDVVLFFDEADALFGKRSEVSDARDRYANLEVAYLLQRLEAFGGVAVLSTNLATNMDEAFSRRLDDVISFRLPDPRERAMLWDRCLGRVLPRDSDVDLRYLADHFTLAGGGIRNCATTAAYGAAQFGPPVCMEDLITAVVFEYRKMGRLCSETEFGDWYPLVQELTG